MLPSRYPADRPCDASLVCPPAVAGNRRAPCLAPEQDVERGFTECRFVPNRAQHHCESWLPSGPCSLPLPPLPLCLRGEPPVRVSRWPARYAGGRCESSMKLPSGSRTKLIRATVPKVDGSTATAAPAAFASPKAASQLRTCKVTY